MHLRSGIVYRSGAKDATQIDRVEIWMTKKRDMGVTIGAKEVLIFGREASSDHAHKVHQYTPSRNNEARDFVVPEYIHVLVHEREYECKSWRHPQQKNYGRVHGFLWLENGSLHAMSYGTAKHSLLYGVEKSPQGDISWKSVWKRADAPTVTTLPHDVEYLSIPMNDAAPYYIRVEQRRSRKRKAS